LRALWQHPPYFHDGSAATLNEVISHYEGALGLTLNEADRADLIEYLKSL
jgi:cytochrome c peroxidase